jgi:hypothetical protein
VDVGEEVTLGGLRAALTKQNMVETDIKLAMRSCSIPAGVGCGCRTSSL